MHKINKMKSSLQNPKDCVSWHDIDILGFKNCIEYVQYMSGFVRSLEC